MRQVEGSWIDAVEGEENRGDDPAVSTKDAVNGEPEEDAIPHGTSHRSRTVSRSKNLSSAMSSSPLDDASALGVLFAASRRWTRLDRGSARPCVEGASASRPRPRRPGGAQREPLAPGLGGRRRDPPTAPAHVDALSPRRVTASRGAGPRRRRTRRSRSTPSPSVSDVSVERVRVARRSPALSGVASGGIAQDWKYFTVRNERGTWRLS